MTDKLFGNKKCDAIYQLADFYTMFYLRDRVINICEMKHSINEFTIDKDYDQSLRNNIQVFRDEPATKRHCTLR